MPFVRTIAKSPKTLYLKYTMLRGKHPHPVLGQNPHPLFPLKSRKKTYDKIRILFYKNTVFSRFLLCFFKLKDLKIFYNLKVCLTTLFGCLFLPFSHYWTVPQNNSFYSHSTSAFLITVIFVAFS